MPLVINLSLASPRLLSSGLPTIFSKIVMPINITEDFDLFLIGMRVVSYHLVLYSTLNEATIMNL